MLTPSNDQLPQTKYFRISRRPWLDQHGRIYFGIDAKANTLDNKAMVFNLPGAHWNLEGLTESLYEVDRQYQANRRLCEEYAS